MHNYSSHYRLITWVDNVEHTEWSFWINISQRRHILLFIFYLSRNGKRIFFHEIDLSFFLLSHDSFFHGNFNGSATSWWTNNRLRRLLRLGKVRVIIGSSFEEFLKARALSNEVGCWAVTEIANIYLHNEVWSLMLHICPTNAFQPIRGPSRSFPDFNR